MIDLNNCWQVMSWLDLATWSTTGSQANAVSSVTRIRVNFSLDVTQMLASRSPSCWMESWSCWDSQILCSQNSYVVQCLKPTHTHSQLSSIWQFTLVLHPFLSLVYCQVHWKKFLTLLFLRGCQYL